MLPYKAPVCQKTSEYLLTYNKLLSRSHCLRVDLQRLPATGRARQNGHDDAGNSRDDDARNCQRPEHEDGRVPALVGGADGAVPVLDEAFQEAASSSRHADRPERVGAERKSDADYHKDHQLGAAGCRHQRHLANANATAQTVGLPRVLE